MIIFHYVLLFCLTIHLYSIYTYNKSDSDVADLQVAHLSVNLTLLALTCINGTQIISIKTQGAVKSS
jgi:hypothetical protein